MELSLILVENENFEKALDAIAAIPFCSKREIELPLRFQVIIISSLERRLRLSLFIMMNLCVNIITIC